MNRRVPLAPAEGWLTLGLVALMCLTLAWSLDDALLVLGDPELTDFLVWAALGGVLAGFIGAKVGWGRWTSHLIGAAMGALLVPILVGMVLLPEGGNPGQLFEATAEAARLAVVDLVVLDRLATTQFGHHLLVLGLLVWASSMFASYAAFGHRRPLNAALLIGLLLVANMGLTTRDQLAYLVLFSLAALFLLIRFHTFDEQTDWLRRRVGDPAAISGLYLRGGTVFIGVAVLSSLLLTTVAASAPLAGVWTDMGGRLIEWSRAIERFLPPSSLGRSIGPSFGPNATIQGVWTTNNDPALTISIAPTEQRVPYWAAVYYDQFDLRGWRQSPTVDVPRAGGEELLRDTGDALSPEGRRELTVTITPSNSRQTVFSAEMPLSVETPVTTRLVGDNGYLGGLERAPSNAPYTVTSLIPIRGDEVDGGLTINRLRVASQDYPAEIEAIYTAVPDGAIPAGGDAEALLAEIVAASGTNPYDLAAGMRDFLRRQDQFTYDPDVRDLVCDDLSVVECFARTRRGYCEHYASTMAILLREQGIPTRLVEGFLPGKRDLGANLTRVFNSDAHAWVQVYFPGYGWVDFDPTGGGRAADEPLPTGRIESAGPSVSASTGPGLTRPPESILPERDEPGGTGGFIASSGAGPGPFIAIALLLGGMVAALAFVAWQRGPRGPVSADTAYGSVTRLAARLGFGPRPEQTVYEYAGALGEVLPGAKPALETVARAKVEVAYGGRVLGDDRLAVLRDAQRRLRLGLLRLALRRKDRGRRR